MADMALLKDVGALGAMLRLTASIAAIAGGAGNAATTTGATIDRYSFGGSLPMVINPAIAYEATLQSGKTLSFGYAVQDSADGTNFADYATATSAVAATGPSGGGAVAGQFDVGSVNLSSARRFIRFNALTTLNATGTDTAVARAMGFAAGFDRVPQ